MIKLVRAMLACLTLSVCATAAAAQTSMPVPPPMPMMVTHMPAQITVTATGSVEYVPDIARVTLGIRAQAPSASSAADSMNRSAAQSISAIEALGIKRNSIKTSGYNLEYREPQPSPNAIAPAPVQVMSGAPAPRTGQYVASEILQVTSPVELAGKVLDAAIAAGANESFGLSYQSSNADALYRSALAKAVQAAHDTAVAIAKAAHVTIDGIASISNTGESQPGFGVMQAAPRALASAVVLPGTDAVTATVYVVYRIK